MTYLGLYHATTVEVLLTSFVMPLANMALCDVTADRELLTYMEFIEHHQLKVL